jgi:hypothetical protein
MKVVFIFVVLACFTSASVAGATPRPLPFTYPNETLNQGELELELYTDVNPLRVQVDQNDPTKGGLWAPEYKLQSEFEYGLTDRVELGFYQVFDAPPVPGGDNSFLFDGLKWRVRTRLAEPGQWPVDVGLYLELETMHDEASLEGKVNLQRRFGPFRWAANLWVEETLSRPLDTVAHGRAAHFIIDPTTGVTLQVTPTFHPGIEFWARGQIEPSAGPLCAGAAVGCDQQHENTRVHYYLGPTAHLNFGRFWWSAGLYAHLNGPETPSVGAAYGPIWFRSVLGMDL